MATLRLSLAQYCKLRSNGNLLQVFFVYFRISPSEECFIHHELACPSQLWQSPPAFLHFGYPRFLRPRVNKGAKTRSPLVSENFDRNFIRLLLSLPQGSGPGNLGNALTAAKYTSYLSQPQYNNISVQHRQQSHQSHPLDTPQVQRGVQPQPQMSIMWDQVKQDGGAWFERLSRKDQSTRESSANLGPQDRPHHSVR